MTISMPIRSIDNAYIVQQIKNGNDQLLNQLYQKYRADFIKFGVRYLQDEHTIIDTYQEAFIVLFESIKSNKFSGLKSSIKTYLFGIGKFMLIKKFNRTIQTQSIEPLAHQLSHNPIEDTVNLTDQQHQILKALDQMNERCKQLLILVYYKQYAPEAIQREMNYKNLNVVKTKKKQCLNCLKRLMVV